ncbi:hypothetical protein OH77DRAFT_1420792 [Trametes cingulata]|nr:hypothetical protein OH77DRAFT_1420792 [Trametes cingulata]
MAKPKTNDARIDEVLGPPFLPERSDHLGRTTADSCQSEWRKQAGQQSGRACSSARNRLWCQIYLPRCPSHRDRKRVAALRSIPHCLWRCAGSRTRRPLDIRSRGWFAFVRQNAFEHLGAHPCDRSVARVQLKGRSARSEAERQDPAELWAEHAHMAFAMNASSPDTVWTSKANTPWDADSARSCTGCARHTLTRNPFPPHIRDKAAYFRRASLIPHPNPRIMQSCITQSWAKQHGSSVLVLGARALLSGSRWASGNSSKMMMLIATRPRRRAAIRHGRHIAPGCRYHCNSRSQFVFVAVSRQACTQPAAVAWRLPVRDPCLGGRHTSPGWGARACRPARHHVPYVLSACVRVYFLAALGTSRRPRRRALASGSSSYPWKRVEYARFSRPNSGGELAHSTRSCVCKAGSFHGC